MQQIHKKYWDLIAKELADEVSVAEAKELASWRQNSPQNDRIYLQSKKDWNMLRKADVVASVDVDDAWQKQMQRIKPQEEGVSTSLLTLSKTTAFRVAAMVVLFFSIGLSLMLLDRERQYTETITGSKSGTPEAIELPDGSRVYLNQQAKLAFSHAFDKERKVKLTGEAFFEVTPNPDKPFVIEAGNARVKVLGTSFNVQASDKEEVEVYVATGKVQLAEKNNERKALVLEPGVVGILNGSALSKHQNTDKNYMAWKTRDLFFDNTRLSDVAQTLNRVYQVKIGFQDASLKDYRINSTFSNQQLDFVVEVICTTLNLEAEKTPSGDIIIKNKQ